MPISNYLRSIREKVGHDLVALTAVSISSSTMKLACCSAGTPKRGSGHFPAVRSTLTNIPPTLRCVNVLKKPVSSFDRKQSSGSLAVPKFLATYPNGDVAYYTTIAFLAEVVGGSHHPGDGEMSELRYFTAPQCEALNVSPASRIIANRAFGASRSYFRPASWLPPS